jgi:hypothetical protein
MAVDSPFDTTDSPTVEVLRTPVTSVEYGFRLGGRNPGPNFLVAGHDPVASLVYARLIRLPSISRIHGTLTLINLNAMEQTGLLSHPTRLIDHNPDDIHFLSYHLDETYQEKAVKEGYWSTLRRCAQLGMISGRGIPSGPNSNVVIK